MIRKLSLVLAFCWYPVFVQAGDVHAILSGDSLATQRVITALESQLPVQLVPTRYDQHWQSKIGPDDLVLAIGSKASQAVAAARLPQPVIYTFSEQQTLPATQTGSWAAVVLDQPLSRLLPVAASLSKTEYRQDIVVAVSSDNTQTIKALRAVKDFPLKIVEVAADEAAGKVVEPYLYNAVALVAVRDKAIWSGNSAKWLLHQAYNFKVPVVGYSQTFLKAGALVSVYATLEQTIAETAELLNYWIEYEVLPKRGVYYPAYQTDVNPSIARALKINPANILRLQGQAHAGQLDP